MAGRHPPIIDHLGAEFEQVTVLTILCFDSFFVCISASWNKDAAACTLCLWLLPCCKGCSLALNRVTTCPFGRGGGARGPPARSLYGSEISCRHEQVQKNIRGK